jgi:type IV pilus assembly protein PilC
MIDAGLPLVQCLELLAGSEPNKRFKDTLVAIRHSLEGGSTFADALKKHPRIFDELWINLVAAGELGGILDTILNRLAEYTEKSMKLKAKVKGAMKYPMTILVVSLVITYGLLSSVIPFGIASSLNHRFLVL